MQEVSLETALRFYDATATTFENLARSGLAWGAAGRFQPTPCQINAASRIVKVGSGRDRSSIMSVARVICRARGDGVRPEEKPPQKRSGLMTPTGRSRDLPVGVIFFRRE